MRLLPPLLHRCAAAARVTTTTTTSASSSSASFVPHRPSCSLLNAHHNTQQRTMSSAHTPSTSTPHTALIPVADGSEEIEAVTLADVLVRGGVHVTLASVGRKDRNVVRMSRGVHLQADLAIEACVDLDFDLIVVPGGLPGANHLRDSKVLIDLLKQQNHAGKWYGAICAAPAVVLYPHGLLPSPATGYPGFDKDLGDEIDYQTQAKVVVTGNCVTSQGPATAMEMGITLVELLCGKHKAHTVAKGLLMPGY